MLYKLQDATSCHLWSPKLPGVSYDPYSAKIWQAAIQYENAKHLHMIVKYHTYIESGFASWPGSEV